MAQDDIEVEKILAKRKSPWENPFVQAWMQSFFSKTVNEYLDQQNKLVEKATMPTLRLLAEKAGYGDDIAGYLAYVAIEDRARLFTHILYALLEPSKASALIDRTVAVSSSRIRPSYLRAN